MRIQISFEFYIYLTKNGRTFLDSVFVLYGWPVFTCFYRPTEKGDRL